MFGRIGFKKMYVGVAVGLGVALVSINLGLAHGEPSAFLRLEQAESRIAFHQIEVDALSREVEAVAQRLARHTRDAETARRATTTMRRQTTGRLRAWEQAFRKADQGQHHWPVGISSDTNTLLRLAQPQALRGIEGDLALLRAVDVDLTRVDALMVYQGRLTVELAQNAAQGESADLERALIVAQAKGADKQEEADKQLDATQAELSYALDGLAKNPSTEDFHRQKGTLLPPVSGPVAHGFGPRKQVHSMSYVRHTGHTYMVAEGTPVQAAAAGIVVAVRRMEGYGNLVVVDHGSEYHTLYAHLKVVDVEVGKAVARGERIATSGQTGSLVGPKLYFELRHRGHAINPKDWFIRL